MCATQVPASGGHLSLMAEGALLPALVSIQAQMWSSEAIWQCVMMHQHHCVATEQLQFNSKTFIGHKACMPYTSRHGLPPIDAVVCYHWKPSGIAKGTLEVRIYMLLDHY